MAFQNLGNFVHATLPLSFGRDSKAVSMSGEVKKTHTEGKRVTCRELKEWWSLSLTHQFPARERRRAGSVDNL